MRPWIPAALAFVLSGAVTAPAEAAPRRPGTEIAVAAERAFDDERWAEAAVALHRVATAETGDADENRKLAEHHLGVALHKLGFHQASLDVLRRIAADRAHPARQKALLWLAKVSATLPEPAGVADVVVGYSAEDIGRYDNPWQHDVASRLRWLSGRGLSRERRWDEAAGALAAVEPGSPDFRRAQMLLGVVNAERGRALPAARAFGRVLATPDEDGVPDEMRALAGLTLGRLYLAEIGRQNAGGAAGVDRGLVGAAMRSLAAVDTRSEHWLDAELEQARALFLAGDAEGALGKAHHVELLFAPGYAYPEAALVRASVYHALCHDEDANAVASRFVAAHEPVARDLAGLLERFGEGSEPALYDFLHQVRSGKSALAAATRGVVENALSDRETLRHLEYVRFLDEDLARLRRAPAALRESALGAWIAETTQRGRAGAIHEGGVVTRLRFQRALAELYDRLARARSIAAASGPAAGSPSPMDRVRSVDAYGEAWPVDGEVWRDEPGLYREHVDFRCGAGEAGARRTRAIAWMLSSPARARLQTSL